MRIFAHVILLGFCLETFAQDSLVKVDQADRSGGLYAHPAKDGKPKDSANDLENATEASMIVQQLFAGMKTPSPVIPPLVQSIESELKKEESNWFPVDQSQPRPEQRMATVSQVDQKLFAAPSSNRTKAARDSGEAGPKSLARTSSPANSKSEMAVGGAVEKPATEVGDAEMSSVVRDGVDSNFSAKRRVVQAEPVVEAPQKNKPFGKLFKSGSFKNRSEEKSTPVFKSSQNHSGEKGPKVGLFKKLFSKSKKSDGSAEVQIEK